MSPPASRWRCCPGPNVTLVIANGLRYGTRSALINILGAQVGLAIVIAVVGIGLTSLVATMGYWFDWVRLAGAAYLIWIGINLVVAAGRDCHVGHAACTAARRVLPAGYAGAAVESEGAACFSARSFRSSSTSRPISSWQVAVLGFTFMVFASLTDAGYALLAGRARALLSERRTRLLSRVSGGFMIGGGLWLALSRSR